MEKIIGLSLGSVIGCAFVSFVVYSVFKFVFSKLLFLFTKSNKVILYSSVLISFVLSTLITYVFFSEYFLLYFFMLLGWLVYGIIRESDRRKVSYFFLLVAGLIVVAIIFRWDVGPEIQQPDGTMIQNKVDRWTGIEWVVIYSINGIQEQPIIPPELFREVGMEYLAETGLKYQIEEMEKQIEEGKINQPRDFGKDENGNFFLADWVSIELEKNELIEQAENEVKQLTIDRIYQLKEENEIAVWTWLFYFIFMFILFFFGHKSHKSKKDEHITLTPE